MNKQWLAAAIGWAAAVFTSCAWSYPEYVQPTGAAGCTSCHNDNYGNGFKPGILAAFEEDGLEGLKNFLHPPAPDTKPVLSWINNKWDITVGESPLVIYLRVFDAENDSFVLRGTAPSGYTLSKVYIDSVSKLPTVDFKWAPTAAQANKIYPLKIYAQETGAGRTLASNTVTAYIQAWPARTTATRYVGQFQLKSAQWKDKRLNLSGQLFFKSTTTTAQRTWALSTLTMSIKSIEGYTISPSVKLVPQTNGNWYKSITLLPNIEKVPCTVKLEYEGLNVARGVILASTSDECED